MSSQQRLASLHGRWEPAAAKAPALGALLQPWHWHHAWPAGSSWVGSRALLCCHPILTRVPLQVRKIVNVIYSSLPSIKAQLALKSLGRALLVLVSKFPREMVTSLLVCSPTCTRYGACSPQGSSPPPTPRLSARQGQPR